jgi:hypothetical protein
MVDIKDVRDWIGSDTYVELLDFLKTKRKVPVNDEQVAEVLLSHDVNKMNAASVSTADLKKVADNKHQFVDFFVAKLKLINGTENEQEGKCEDDDDDVVLKVHPFYKNFLNIYLIELFLLISKPELLDSYLKAIRIPNSKKYANQLRVAYKSIL